jgi:two-component system cell cycle sensor histidine kinase/response regulator CckA
MTKSETAPGEKLLKTDPATIRADMRSVERKQWWLSFSGVLVTLLLTIGIVSFTLSVYVLQPNLLDDLNIPIATRALVGMVLLFVVYMIYQQLQIHRFRMRLLEREELFRLITENAADMIAVVTVDGQRLYNSPSYEKVLGYSPAELKETSSYAQIHPEDQEKVSEAAQEARRTGVGSRVEYRVCDKAGDWHVLESTASAVRNADGKVEKLVIVNRDITERKQLEQQLILSQKLEAIGRLSGGVAHDFNNILGVIIGYAEALQQEAGSESQNEAVEEILKAGHRAASLTQQLLAFSRKQVLEPKILDLNAVVADVDKMLRRLIGEDIDLKVTASADLGTVKADRGQIEQVLMNLAVNARDAMPRGGQLHLETSNIELRAQDLKDRKYVIPGQYVMLQVIDAGCGMSAEVQARIFEPFFTTKETGKGTGLGLATVYGVIKQSGGYIWVESEQGRGATFKIFLPRAEGAAVEVAQSTSPKTEAHGPRTILIAEDEPSLRKLTAKALNGLGHSVLDAPNAAEAIEIANEFHGTIDLLLTDVVMPGMSGRELAQSLATSRPGMKVVYMSGYTDGALADHGVLQGGISMLRKPFTHAQLTRCLEDIFEVKPYVAAVKEGREYAESGTKTG